MTFEEEFESNGLRHTENKRTGVSAGGAARGPRGGSRRAIALSVGSQGRVVEAGEET